MNTVREREKSQLDAADRLTLRGRLTLGSSGHLVSTAARYKGVGRQRLGGEGVRAIFSLVFVPGDLSDIDT